MAQEIEKYNELIEQLKTVVHEPDFNQIFQDSTTALTKPKQYLLKLELRRLARPCEKVIDLRSIIQEECQAFEYEGLIHYLDGASQALFERQIRAFGEYTIGVYEAVLPTDITGKVVLDKVAVKVASEKPKKKAVTNNDYMSDIDASEHLVDAFDFSRTVQRTEERMNFIVAVELVAPNNQTITGSTIDVSVSGIKIKTLDEMDYRLDTRFTVFFRGLEKDFSLDRKKGIYYKLVKYERTKQDHQLALMRDSAGPNPQFDEFLNKFIQGNKRRYKVNIENTLHAIKSKTFEQYYVPYFSSVPVFIEYSANRFTPSMILTNDNNKDSIYYWMDNDGKMILSQILHSDRIKDLLDHPLQDTYLFTFNNVRDNKLHFYTATETELDRKRQLKNVFMGFGSRKASWRVFKLQITQIKAEQCYRPLSVPDNVSENVKKLNAQPPARLMTRLNSLHYVLLMTDITDVISTQAYQRRNVVRDQLPALQPFSHLNQAEPTRIPMYRFKYQSLRFETRYQLRSPVIAKWQGRTIEGITEDVSTGGMSVELNKEFPGDRLSIVEITLPELQRQSPSWTLVDLKYEVRFVSRDKNVIKLKAFTDKGEPEHPATGFFNFLIKTNKSKLKADTDQEEIEGIGEALRNIYCSNVLNVGFFIMKDGIYFHPHAMTLAHKHHRLLNLFSFATKDRTSSNIFPLYAANGKYEKFVADTLRKLKAKSPPVVRELFVKFKPNETSLKGAMESRFLEQFKNDHERRQYIVRAMAEGVFYCIRVQITRTGRPDQDILRTELGYVSVYAPHKAKELEEELWGIAGAGDIIDITDEAMKRYGFTDQHVHQNQHLDKQIFLHEQENQE